MSSKSAVSATKRNLFRAPSNLNQDIKSQANQVISLNQSQSFHSSVVKERNLHGWTVKPQTPRLSDWERTGPRLQVGFIDQKRNFENARDDHRADH